MTAVCSFTYASETGDVVHVGEGRKEESLLPFLKRLKRLRVSILAVATDMWPAYLKAIRQCYPDIGVMFDRYHLMARYSKLLDALRAEEYRKAGKAHKQVFKGVRYLLLPDAPGSLPNQSKATSRDFWPTSDTRYLLLGSRGSTTRSRSSNARPMDTVTSNTSS